MTDKPTAEFLIAERVDIEGRVMKKLMAVFSILCNIFVFARIALFLSGYWDWENPIDRMLFSVIIIGSVLILVLETIDDKIKVIMS